MIMVRRYKHKFLKQSFEQDAALCKQKLLQSCENIEKLEF